MTTFAVNKKAKFDYQILESFEAGLVLTGPEVKSIRSNHISLKGAFITFHGNIPFLTNASISKYRHAGNIKDYDPTRSRELLLKAKEINYLRGKLQEKGLTVVPLSIYTKKRYLKIEIALAKGKKQYDKRETIKKRELNREMKRNLSF